MSVGGRLSARLSSSGALLGIASWSRPVQCCPSKRSAAIKCLTCLRLYMSYSYTDTDSGVLPRHLELCFTDESCFSLYGSGLASQTTNWIDRVILISNTLILGVLYCTLASGSLSPTMYFVDSSYLFTFSLASLAMNFLSWWRPFLGTTVALTALQQFNAWNPLKVRRSMLCNTPSRRQHRL